MIEKLKILGINEKEASVYLYLVEYGVSPASEVAKHILCPKSTANFLLESLWQKGIVSKTIRTNTHYYEADIALLESHIEEKVQVAHIFLSETLPLLREMNRNIHTKPKITFLDGRDMCRQAYGEILDAGDIFHEFGNHADLVRAFGEEFMTYFIAERVRRGIFCDSIGTEGLVESALRERDASELRSLFLFDTSFGQIGSSIAIYRDTVLVLNLDHTYIGVKIQNPSLADTLRTVFRICKRKT